MTFLRQTPPNGHDTQTEDRLTLNTIKYNFLAVDKANIILSINIWLTLTLTLNPAPQTLQKVHDMNIFLDYSAQDEFEKEG